MQKLLFVVGIMSMVLSVLAVDGNIICSKAQNIQDQWVGVLPGRPPMIPVCSKVVKGEPFTVNVFFVNPALRGGWANVSCKLTMYDPDGNAKHSVDLKPQKFSCTNPNQVFLFPDFLGVSFDPPDALGSYLFKAVLRDEPGGAEQVAETRVELCEKMNAPVSPKPMDALTNYYASPCPQNIIPAFKEFLAQVPAQKQKQGKNFTPVSMLSLFYYALDANPQIWPEFADYMETLDGENQQMAILMVSSLGPEFAKLLGADLSKSLVKFSFRIETVTVPWQLDVLWSEFLVTGRKEPIMKIAGTVARFNTGLTIEKYKELPAPTDADRQALMSYLVGRAALWSLSSNAKQHKLVANYLECALAHQEFKDPFVMGTLGRMMSEVVPAVKAQTTK